VDLSKLHWEALLLGYPLLLLALTVHESAHAWTADRFGDPTARFMGRVSLNPLVHVDLFGTVVFPILAFLTAFPMIGWAKPVPVNPRQLRNPSRDGMIISLAGPASNVLLAILFFALYAAFRLSGVFGLVPPLFREPLFNIFLYGTLLNALLALFNLLPVPPLDGSHVVEHFLPYSWRQAYEAIRPYSFFLLLGLFMFGMLNILFKPIIWVVVFLFELV